MIGQRIAHYRITAAIGAGGMGQVYRATDTRLHRDVALKVLPPEMAASPERIDRFQREARAVAALNHPHVVTIYSVEQADGVHFLTMELVDGESLDRLIPAGGMTVPRLLDIAGALADALAAAHDKGIVHRDLKPANVMVTKEGVKVLDFGLAKIAAPADSLPTLAEDQPTEMRTREGVVMGTIPYMSPEQLHGHALDHRTDLFSLGVMLYEMASGERPFRGDSSVALASAILRDAPKPLVEKRKDLPEEFIRLVMRCLEKSAADRFSTASELRGALRGVTLEKVARPARTEGAEVTRADERLWVAVLPFKCAGSDADLAALADGLAEEIATGLSRFRYLSVVSSTAAARLKEESGSGARLGARYVVEGSMRMGGSAIRVSAQLIDTESGAQIWSETFNRDLKSSSFFAVQDDLSARIVATVADSYGVLVHSMRSAMRQKDDAALTPAEWQFQYFAYREQITPAAHAALKNRLERALKRDDAQSDLWACLAQIHVDEYAFGFGNDESSLDRALTAARRAVELDRANQFALVALAQTHFFRRDLAAFGPAAERAMALNPLNTDAVGILGLQIVHTGEFERGAAIVRRAMELNANHAGWMHFAPLWEHFHKGEYEQALERANRVDVPGLFWPFLVMAAACGHLGRRAEAEAAVRDLLALDPQFAAHARSNIASWHFASGLLEPLLEGLRKAGLSIPATEESLHSPTVAKRTDRAKSGEVRAEEGFWVAVLPFKYSGNDSDLTSLADGLTESIVTGLSRFTYLRVIARNSVSQIGEQPVDVRSAGNELGARYVMEGSLRKAGTKLRLAVQLVDTTSGAHLWAETYDRAFDPDVALELQDDLTARIVSTCADRFGVLARSISDSIREMEPGQLGPYEALMRGFGYHHRLTPDEHAEAREALERAVERAPSNADCWAMLSWIYSHEHAHGFNARPGSLDRALAAARRAVDLAPSNQLAQQALAVVFFFRKETLGCLSAAERAIALNPLDTSNEAIFLITFLGDWDRGCALVRRAMELNPHHPRWYGMVLGINAYRLANYRAAVDEIVKANAREVFWSNMMLAAAHAQLGDLNSARDALRDLLAQKNDFAQSPRQFLSKWFDRELVGHLIEGLRKAGMEVADESSAALPAQISIAVLPFSDMSAAKDQEYLCEGMAEEIMNALMRIDGMRVASRTSAFRAAKSSGGDLDSISRSLSVGHVLEGSVRTAGARLRVTAQLTDVASHHQLWSQRFDKETLDVFAIQDEIAAGVVDAVKASLAPGARTIHARPQATNLEAYRSYLKGRHLRGKEDFRGAMLAFEEAVRLDPAHAPSWTGLAEITVLSAHMGIIPPRAACPAARAALAKAREIQGESADALHVEAFVAWLERKWDAMETSWRRALELQPDHVLALGSFAISLCARQRFDEAMPLFDRAREADPLASFPYTLTGWGLLLGGRPIEAVRQIEDALTFEKEDGSALAALGIAKVALGQLDEGIAASEHAVAVTQRAPFFLGVLGWALVVAGRRDDARSILDELRARPAGSPTVISEAWMLGALGEVDAAFDVLARAEEEYQGLVSYTGLPGFDSLRADARFGELQRRLQLAA